MRLVTVERVSELDISSVEVEFIHESDAIAVVVIRDPATNFELRIRRADNYSDSLKVMRREDREKVTRFRVSGYIAGSIPVSEYFEDRFDAEQRRSDIRAATRSDVNIEVKEVECYVDDHGKVTLVSAA